MTTPLVDFDDVSLRLGTTQILRSANLRLAGGEAVGLFGPNGAGKTTLLRLIATLLKPTGGAAHVLGVDITTPQRIEVRHRIGYVGHEPALYPEMTLLENTEFAASLQGQSTEDARAALASVGLDGAADRRAEQCSHGMRRRAEFARVLLHPPDLLLLDEPHSALDADAAALVDEMARHVTTRGGGVVVASHDRDRVIEMTNRTVELGSGNLDE